MDLVKFLEKNQKLHI
jgi:hypothetical protein